SQEEAFNHPRRNVLTRALGTSPEVIVDITDTELAPGDILMFCTDGLTGVIRDEELHLMLRGREVSQTIQELLAAALDRGGVDNITMVLVEV
ncbi:MAG TPA: SpoIIE family protein phosphatase, partial [Bacillota bacterium]|nr:SpoIIE family protein phosphatase [Bacillota bacterium]